MTLTASSNDDVFVITAPSGTGKTTLNRRLMKDPGLIGIAISMTTRPRREGEINGDHYWFVDEAEFFAEVRKGAMLEWASVFGNYYGTCYREIERIRGEGHKIILEIDVQGWTQAREKLPGAVSIFIMPPSLSVLWERLTGRASDSPGSQWRRIQTAREELDHAPEYQYFVINDRLESALAELKGILMNQPDHHLLSRKSGLEHCQKLKEEWEKSPVFRQLRTQFSSGNSTPEGS
ncbi:MAG: guanylate kinase [Deltaproteobacteria bacterium]|nr:guanylate kinase [Deltaproteobacteria bacterium]